MLDKRKRRAAPKGSVRSDIYQDVTNDIIAMLEAGTKPWSPAWSKGLAILPQRSCGKPYQGINVILLWAQAARKGFANPAWMTFKQALELGGNVRRGEKGVQIVYAGSVAPKDEGQDERGSGEAKRRIPFLKRYTVFNAEQIDGLPAGKFPTPKPVIVQREARDPALDALFAAYGVFIAELPTGGACYDSVSDCISMPHFVRFTSGNAYYATLAHEAIHSSGHQSRLARDTLIKYGANVATRAKEELCAEIGAAFLCAALGMEPSEREDHAAYLADWLTVLKSDKRAIFHAATAAQAASDFIVETAARAIKETAA